MRQIFHATDLQTVFDERGYIKMDLLNTFEVAQLLECYDELKPKVENGFHATMYIMDPEHRRAVKECIETVVKSLVAPHLCDYRLCAANFVVKEGVGHGSEVGFHQDWSFVDERQYRSVHVWCPLVDTNRENGCLGVFPGTQRYGNLARAHFDPCPFGQVLPALQEHSFDEEPTRAGHALFYDGALLHGSRENHSGNRRVGIVCVLVPAEATLTHCFRISSEAVETFAVDVEFFLHHVPGTRPTGYPRIGTTTSRLHDVTSEEIAPLLQ